MVCVKLGFRHPPHPACLTVLQGARGEVVVTAPDLDPSTGDPVSQAPKQLQHSQVEAQSPTFMGRRESFGEERNCGSEWPQNTLHAPPHLPTLTGESSSDLNVMPRILENRNLDLSGVTWSHH